LGILPKKLSSSIAVSELWTSVGAHEAELERVRAELRLLLQAPQQALPHVGRLHHLARQRLVVATGSVFPARDPMSPANSSFGDIAGCVSLLPSSG